ncbi:MAG: polysaccharide pyruvyl transferase CsaB [Bacillota bacterium]
MRRIVISGYYGFDNLGDEAILGSMIKMIKTVYEDIEITVLSNKAEQTSERYGVNSIYRYDIFEIVSAMRRSDVFISGGGSLLQDITSMKSVPYYLGLIFLAEVFNLKTVFFAQGVGPLNKKFNRFLVSKVLKNTDYISVRDKDSKELLEKIGLNRNVINITDDPVYGLYNKRNKELEHKQREIKKIGVSVRSWNDNSYIKSIADFLNNLKQDKKISVEILPFHKGEDIIISSRLKKMLKMETKIIDYTDDFTKINDIYSDFDLFLGVRFHSLVFAAVNLVPFIGISYDPKVTSLIDDFGYQDLITTDTVTKDLLIKEYSKITGDLSFIKRSIDDIVNIKSSRTKSTVKQIFDDMKGE